MGRMATEEDFRGVIAFLASAASGYITRPKYYGGWRVGSLVDASQTKNQNSLLCFNILSTLS